MDSLLNTYLTLLKMAANDPRYDSMLFNYETTSRSDFRNGAILDFKPTVYQEQSSHPRRPPPVLKDIQTLTEWKQPCIPTELMVKPKDIVRTDPRKIQQAYAPLEDVDKERARRARPRLVMTPAVSMDDIQDEQKREILTKDMYTSSTKSAMLAGIASDLDGTRNVKAPLQGTLTPANPITLERLQFPRVSRQWRMRTVPWDCRQLRGHADPTRDFYMARPLRCKICQTALIERDRKMKRISRNMK